MNVTNFTNLTNVTNVSVNVSNSSVVNGTNVSATGGAVSNGFISGAVSVLTSSYFWIGLVALILIVLLLIWVIRVLVMSTSERWFAPLVGPRTLAPKEVAQSKKMPSIAEGYARYAKLTHSRKEVEKFLLSKGFDADEVEKALEKAF
ncbi:MAG: hypothetical protein ACOCXG_01600 [Nanoarchaeota archaeon]